MLCFRQIPMVSLERNPSNKSKLSHYSLLGDEDRRRSRSKHAINRRLKANLRCFGRMIYSKQYGVLQRPSLMCFMRQKERNPYLGSGKGKALSRTLQMTAAARPFLSKTNEPLTPISHLSQLSTHRLVGITNNDGMLFEQVAQD